METKVFRPAYFKKFACIAGKCEESCCKAGWEIPIDDETFAVYSSLEGEIGKKFKTSTVTGTDGDTVFKLDENGDCPFLNTEGLCELYIATNGKLCEICTNYPRFFEEFDGFTESGISISCPEAQRLVFKAQPEDYCLGDESSDDELLELLISERRLAFDLADSENSAEEALLGIILRAEALQDLIDLGIETNADSIDSVEKADPNETMLKICKWLLNSTDILCPEWKTALEAGNVPQKSIDTRIKKNYLKYLIYRYYLKAINREDILSQTELIAILYLLPLLLEGDYGLLCRLAAKETEHDAENAEVMLDGLYSCEYITPNDIKGTLKSLICEGFAK